MTSLPRARRGQSIVELTLSLIVFVTVLMFGIHFAELGYLPIKVHEAAVSPLWDATALRVHRMTDNPSKIANYDTFPGIPMQVELDANGRYRDFDGRSSTPGGNPALSHLFTRIEGMKVECRRENRIEFDLPRGAPPSMLSAVKGDFGGVAPGTTPGASNESVLNGVYENMGGVACTAEARVESLPALPVSFLEGRRGFFSEAHAKKLRMKVCAVGRPRAGEECQGRYGVLLGDFAFADTQVSGNCPLQPERPDQPCGSNRSFYYAAKKIYDNNRRAASRDASRFAQFFVGYSPIDEGGFFMSYRGEEDNYIERDTPAGEALDMVDRPRNTGGVEHKPALRRKSNRCFLGLNKC
ncbi:pilus assembly protein [Archangium primigenium]|uniref:pilus assembly protein n=1 Tax=[Archangium] primigenium TaxID=2792470 RepID=UPI0019595E5D|nr:pilus assembly protein [Archangium primigenium]MBM7117885.1 pilus assembly protein [Archangium primigenium]